MTEMFKPAELKFIWKHRGNKNYELQNFIANGKFIEFMVFKDIGNRCQVLGKIIISPQEGEGYHWPRLKHENLAPLIDIVSINEKLSVYISPFYGRTLKCMVNEEEFKNHSDCFDRKKFYAEDVLFGLDYLHRKYLCLMNLNDENIFINYEPDKAIITNFCCLTLTKRATKTKFAMRPYYLAPELISENNYDFNAVQAEMWACGIMMVELFTQNNESNNIHLETCKAVMDSVTELDLQTLKNANKGSVVTQTDVEDLKNFLKLFLNEHPAGRTTAGVAAISYFLRTSVPRANIVRKTLLTANNSLAIFSDLKYQRNCNNDPPPYMDSYACEAAKCRAQLKKEAATNKFIHLDFVSETENKALVKSREPLQQKFLTSNIPQDAFSLKRKTSSALSSAFFDSSTLIPNAKSGHFALCEVAKNPKKCELLSCTEHLNCDEHARFSNFQDRSIIFKGFDHSLKSKRDDRSNCYVRNNYQFNNTNVNNIDKSDLLNLKNGTTDALNGENISEFRFKPDKFENMVVSCSGNLDNPYDKEQNPENVYECKCNLKNKKYDSDTHIYMASSQNSNAFSSSASYPYLNTIVCPDVSHQPLQTVVVNPFYSNQKCHSMNSKSNSLNQSVSDAECKEITNFQKCTGKLGIEIHYLPSSKTHEQKYIKLIKIPEVRWKETCSKFNNINQSKNYSANNSELCNLRNDDVMIEFLPTSDEDLKEKRLNFESKDSNSNNNQKAKLSFIQEFHTSAATNDQCTFNKYKDSKSTCDCSNNSILCKKENEAYHPSSEWKCAVFNNSDRSLTHAKPMEFNEKESNSFVTCEVAHKFLPEYISNYCMDERQKNKEIFLNKMKYLKKLHMNTKSCKKSFKEEIDDADEAAKISENVISDIEQNESYPEIRNRGSQTDTDYCNASVSTGGSSVAYASDIKETIEQQKMNSGRQSILVYSPVRRHSYEQAILEGLNHFKNISDSFEIAENKTSCNFKENKISQFLCVCKSCSMSKSTDKKDQRNKAWILKGQANIPFPEHYEHYSVQSLEAKSILGAKNENILGSTSSASDIYSKNAVFWSNEEQSIPQEGKNKKKSSKSFFHRLCLRRRVKRHK